IGSTAFVVHRRASLAPVALPVADDRAAPAAAAARVEATEAIATPEPAPAPAPRAERASSPKTLSAEVTSLDGVKQSLVTGNPSAALAALGKYHASFPAPMLGPEATVLEVEALMAMGDQAHRARAIAIARRFVRMHP